MYIAMTSGDDVPYVFPLKEVSLKSEILIFYSEIVLSEKDESYFNSMNIMSLFQSPG
jgi:hypothetical protein